MLKEAGIPVQITPPNWPSPFVELQVPQEHREAAAEILAAHQRVQKVRRELPENTCLVCGTEMADEASACTACGWSYASPEPLEESETFAAAQPKSSIPLVLAVPVTIVVVVLIYVVMQYFGLTHAAWR